MERIRPGGAAPSARARANEIVRRVLLAVLLVLCGQLAQAQTPAALHQDLGLVVNGRIDAIARQPDGGVVFGGSFSSVNGVPRQNIARLNPDGTLDLQWNPGADNLVTALAVDSTGAVYVGGSYYVIAGQARNTFAKLLGTGTGEVDPDWTHNGGANGSSITAIAVAADDSVFVGGSFTWFEGLMRNGLAKLASDGTPDVSWNPGPSGGIVTDLEFDADGSLFAAGYFFSIGGQTRHGVARLSPTGTGDADPTWNPGSTGARVLGLARDGASLFVGGEFTTMGGLARQNLAKLSTGGTGAAEPDWNPGADGQVVVLARGNDGAIHAGGYFQNIGGLERPSLARLSPTGTGAADAAFDWPLLNGSDTPGYPPFVRIYALAVDIDGTVYAGGEFSTIGGLPRMGLAALDAARPAIDVEKPGQVRALASVPGGGVIIGGHFLKAGSYYRRNLLRTLPDGSVDATWVPDTDGQVEALAVDAGGDVYAGGLFTQAGGASRTRLAKISAATGVAVAGWAPEPNAEVHALAVDAGALFVGGNFLDIGATPRTRLAKLNAATGAVDTGWAGSADGVVRALVVDSGQLYAGGNFVFLSGQFRRAIGRVSTTTGTADSWSPSPNDQVLSLAVGPDAVYAGGLFSSIGGQSRSYVAKLSRSTGSADVGWNANSGSMVRAMRVDGGVLYATGDFQTIGGASRTTLARLLGDGSADPTWNPSPNWSYGYALAFDGPDAIYVGGSFVTVGTAIRQGVAAVPLTKTAQAALTATANPTSLFAGATSQLGTSGGSGTGAVSYAVTAGAASCSVAGATLTGIAAGSCTVTATKAGDGAFLPATATVNLTVTQPNQAPTLVLLGDRAHASGTAGGQTAVGFASSNAGEGGQTVTFHASVTTDPQDIVGALAIDAAGTLSYTLTGRTGAAVVRVVAQDDGGTAGGGQDTSAPVEFRILVGEGANVALSIGRTPAMGLAAHAAGKAGAATSYTVTVTNHGPQDVSGLGVRVQAIDMTDILWACTMPSGACAPANGSGGSISTTVSLLVGQSAQVEISGHPNAFFNYIELRASLQMPAGVALLSSGEELDSYVEPSNGIAVFRAGFE